MYETDVQFVSDWSAGLQRDGEAEADLHTDLEEIFMVRC